jgi:peroxiredoxin Q/BCP
VAYFMVSLDSPEKNREFAESLDANFPLLSDPGKQVARAYGVVGLVPLFAKRRTFFIDPQGVIRHVEEEVDPATHGEQIVRTLAELGFPRAPEAPATESDEAASP